MAGQEILRSSQVYEGGIGLSVFSGQEAFSSWNEEDLQYVSCCVGEISVPVRQVSLARWNTCMVVDRIALGR